MVWTVSQLLVLLLSCGSYDFLNFCLHFSLCMRWMNTGCKCRLFGGQQDSSSKSLPSSHQVGPWDLTQVVKPRGEYLDSMSSLTSPQSKKNLFGIWSCVRHALCKYFFRLCFTFVDMAACSSSFLINCTSTLVSKSYMLKPADLNWFHMFMVKNPLNMLPSLPC